MLRSISLPLLGKELEEQAARGRTYHIRLGYALVLFATFFTIYDEVVGASPDTITALGQGGRLFEPLITILFAYVCLVVPAFTSGVVNTELRAGSLELLELSNLGPTSIVVQKFFGRLIPVLCNLVIAVPVLLLTYSFGGVSLEQLLVAAAALVMTAVLVSAIALDMSCVFHSLEGAFGATALVMCSLGIVAGAAMTSMSAPWSDLGAGVAPPAVLWRYQSTASLDLTLGLAQVAIAILMSSLFLLDAIRRLRGLTNVQRATGGKSIGFTGILRGRSVHAAPWPNRRPIAWRERHRRLLGRPRFALLFVGLVIVLATIAAFGIPSGAAQIRLMFQDRLAILVLSGLWLGTLLVAVAGTVGSISSERVEKTFEVLMTTPMTGPEILRDKMIGVRRFQVSVLTAACVITIVGFQGQLFDSPDHLTFAAAMLTGLTIDLAMFSWLAVFIGLRVPTPERASVITLLVAFGIAVLPIIFVDQGSVLRGIGVLVSPVVLFVATFEPLWTGTGSRLTAGDVVSLALVHLAIYAILRRYCVRHADRSLGRVEFDWWSRQRANSPF